MNNNEIMKVLIELIHHHALNKMDFGVEKDFFTELYFDSLAFSALIVEIEDCFNISITKDDVIAGIRTPLLLADLIQRKLN